MEPAATSSDVILVDTSDRPIGVESKLAAHQNGGRLHRAFSVFILNSAGEMLLQKRSGKKYHFGGLWTNACCSHPRPHEAIGPAAQARLKAEFGFETPLVEAFSFVYRASDAASGLTEHEFDHVLFGQYDGEPTPNADEIDDWKWEKTHQLLEDVRRQPAMFTPWFQLSLERVLNFARSTRTGNGSAA